MSYALVPRPVMNPHVMRMLVEARAADLMAERLGRVTGDPKRHLREAYGILNKLAGRPALLAGE